MIKITESAKKHIISILEGQDLPILMFGVKSGGCAGFEYFWHPLDEKQYKPEEGDEIIELNSERKLVIDGISAPYIIGCEIDFNNDIMGSYLTVNNPLAASSCGCGTSVSF